MKMRNTLFNSALLLAGLGLMPGTAEASPLVNLSILGGTSLAGPYSSSLSGLTAGETVYLELVGTLAPVGTTNSNGSRTVTSESSTKDGISSLNVNLTSTLGVFTPLSESLATPNTTPSAKVDWTSGSGTSGGVVLPTTVTGIRPAINGVDTSTISGSSDVIWFATQAFSGLTTTVTGANNGSGAFKINGGTSIFITTTTEASADPFVSFSPLTLSSGVVGTPEPATMGLLTVGSAALLRRRRVATA